VSTITAAAYASSLAAARNGTHTTGQLATRRLQSVSDIAPAAKTRKILQRSLLGNNQQQQQHPAAQHNQATHLNSYLGSMFLAPLPAVDMDLKSELENREPMNVTILMEDMPGVPRYINLEGAHQHGTHP
jgi:hypothetical protein